MKETSDRRPLESTASASKTGIARIARILFGGLITTIGVLMAGIMAVAMFHEIVADDFFGTSVCILVVVFGMQITKIGYQAITGQHESAAEMGPWDDLRRSDTGV